VSAAPTPLVIDVRPMIEAGVEPRARLFAAVNELAPAQSLVVIAPFLPSPLIERLKADDLEATATHRADGAWEVRFAK
jgi:uncharacterized protein (DUF2249 family)